MLQKLATTARAALGLPRKFNEEEFKRWRRESTDPVVRSGKCYVPMPGFEDRKHFSDKQNLHHLGRYEWAAKVLSRDGAQPGRVLDCTCGVGYGTAKLAAFADAVEGIDSYGLAVSRARTHYDLPNATWHERDVSDLRSLFVDDAFDAIVCFQTIECIEDDTRFLDDLHALLKPGGVLLIDTPVRPRHEDNPENPHHKRHYSLDEWLDLLTGRFHQVRAFEDLPEAEFLKSCGMPSTGSIAHCVK